LVKENIRHSSQGLILIYYILPKFSQPLKQR